MTPDEMGAELGREWTQTGSDDIPCWERTHPKGSVELGANGEEWWVEGCATGLACATPEAAVAAARLLVAAERVAAGAEVAPNRGRLAVPGFVDAYATTAVTTGVPMVATAIPTRVTPAEARRTAVHLLRAADEAELAE